MMVLIPPTAPGTGGRGIRVAALGVAPLAGVTLEAAMGLRTRFCCPGPGPLTKTGCPVGLPTGLTVICWGGATVAC